MKRALAVLLVFVMLSSVASPVLAANTAKMKPVMTTERNELHKNIKIVGVDSALENETP